MSCRYPKPYKVPKGQESFCVESRESATSTSSRANAYAQRNTYGKEYECELDNEPDDIFTGFRCTLTKSQTNCAEKGRERGSLRRKVVLAELIEI